MYHTLFDSSLKMPIGKILQVTALVQCPCLCLPVILKNLFHFPPVLYRKRETNAHRMQTPNLPELMEQCKRTDIIQDIITFFTMILHREQIPITVLQIENTFSLITPGCIFMQALGAEHHGLVTI